MSYRRAESVLVLICTTANDILLLKRKPSPVFWQSVTGSLEAGETPAQAAVREMAEETGITDADVMDCHHQSQFEIRPEWRSRYAPGVTTNTEHVFLCRLAVRPEKIILAADEHSEYQWLPLDQAIDKVWSSSNRDALQRFA